VQPNSDTDRTKREQVPERQEEVRDRPMDEALDVKVVSIATEGASQCVCHNPCM